MSQGGQKLVSLDNTFDYPTVVCVLGHGCSDIQSNGLCSPSSYADGSPTASGERVGVWRPGRLREMEETHVEVQDAQTKSAS